MPLKWVIKKPKAFSKAKEKRKRTAIRMEDESVSWHERKKRRREWSKCGSLVSGCLSPWPLATHVRTSSSKLSISQPRDLGSPPGARSPRLTHLSKSNTSHCSLGYWYICLNCEGLGVGGGGEEDMWQHITLWLCRGQLWVACQFQLGADSQAEMATALTEQSNKDKPPIWPLIIFQFQEETNGKFRDDVWRLTVILLGGTWGGLCSHWGDWTEGLVRFRQTRNLCLVF